MKFETKILGLLVIALVVSFSVINATSVVYIRSIIEDSLINEAYLYSKLLLYNKDERYPDYFFISEEPLLKEDFKIIAYTGRHYVSVKNKYIEKKLSSYITFILFWEAGSIITLLLVFYYTNYRYLKKERTNKELLNLVLMALTHRLGNFLAVHKVNIELITQRKLQERLKRSISILENTYNSAIETMEALRSGQEEPREYINLPQVLLEIAVLYGDTTDKSVKLQVNSGISIKANSTYLRMLIDTLIDNAIKYSESRVYVRLLRYKGKNLLVVRNDIGEREISAGSGMGLRIAKYICEQLNFKIKIKTRKTFTVAVCM